jgi:hypothetical protein
MWGKSIQLPCRQLALNVLEPAWYVPLLCGAVILAAATSYSRSSKQLLDSSSLQVRVLVTCLPAQCAKTVLAGSSCNLLRQHMPHSRQDSCVGKCNCSITDLKVAQ